MDEITYMDKLGDIKHIITKEITNMTNNRTITVSRIRKWENLEKNKDVAL